MKKFRTKVWPLALLLAGLAAMIAFGGYARGGQAPAATDAKEAPFTVEYITRQNGDTPMNFWRYSRKITIRYSRKRWNEVASCASA